MSVDGENFKNIKSIDANNKASNNYHINDNSEIDFVYYRLKIEEWSGHIEYSHVISQHLNCDKSNDQLLLFPNPVVENSSIQVIHEGFRNSGTLQVTNNTGQVIFQQSIEMNAAENSIELDLNNYVPGVYYIMLSDD